jgi:hypothetical protein
MKGYVERSYMKDFLFTTHDLKGPLETKSWVRCSYLHVFPHHDGARNVVQSCIH